MSKKRENPAALRVLAIAGPAALAVVVACDADAPGTVITAVDETVTALEAEGKLDSEDATRIRMFGSADGNAAPIVYVDGVRVDMQDGTALDWLSPDKIERVEVVKGSAAVESYGAEGEAGVIQIVTNGEASADDMELVWVGPGGGEATLVRTKLSGESSSPIVYIDGVRAEEGREAMDALDPRDIDRMEVTNDGSGAVIRVFTKKRES